MPLSDIQIRKLKPVAKQKKHTDGNGLYLLQTPAGGKIWRMNFRIQGVNKTMVFGCYPEISLKNAMEMCMKAREKLEKGIDPTVKEGPAKGWLYSKKIYHCKVRVSGIR